MASRFLPLALALLALSACGPRPPESAPQIETANTPAPAPARQVRAVAAQPGTLTSQRSTSVAVEPSQEARVAAGASGRVEAVLKRPGSRVAAGEAVVQLETENARLQRDNARLALESARVNLASAESASREGAGQAEAALRSAEVALELARKRYQEGQQLVAAGGMAANDLAALESQLAQAEAGYRQAQDALARSGRAEEEDVALLRLQLEQAQNQLEQAERALAETSITAPFAGEIAEVMTEVGEFVAAGSPVFRLVSSARQLARFSVPPEDAAQLQREGLVQIRYGGLDYAAQIVRSSEVPGDASRLVELTAMLYEAQTRIPTGAVAQLSYTVTLGEGVIVPSGALSSAGGESAVLVVEGEEARVRRQPVRLVAEAEGQAAVAGLEPGQRVVYPLPSDLRDGARVVVMERSEAP